jgi:large subunit ribosomal protein L5
MIKPSGRRLNLKETYLNDIIPELKLLNGYKNTEQVPKILKICVSCGVGEATKNPKELTAVLDNLSKITGQKPKINKSKKSVAGFKLRQDMDIGSSVTLRKARMYAFLERLIHIVLPRIRDFKGINPQGFDGDGNYNFGITDQLIFPELSYESGSRTRGLNISIVTNARTDDEGYALLRLFGMPFVPQNQKF